MDSNQFQGHTDQQLEEIIRELRVEAGMAAGTRGTNSRSAGRHVRHRTSLLARIGGHAGFRRGAVIAGGAALLLFVALTAYTYLYGSIHHGLRAGTISIGGMSQSEASGEIAKDGASALTGKSIALEIYGKDYPVEIAKVATGLDSTTTAQEAYAYTHEGGLFTRVGHTLGALIGHHSIPLKVAINQKALAVQLDEIAAKAMTGPVQPSWTLNGSTLTIDRGKAGVSFDQAKVESEITEQIRALDFQKYKVDVKVAQPNPIDVAQIKAKVDCQPKNATVAKDGETILPAKDGVELDAAAAQKIIGAGDQQTYSVPVKCTPADVTASELSGLLFRNVLSSASTSYNTSKADRVTNVRLAASYINGIILNPGEEFSYNELVGERTAERGFREAGAYSNGEVVSQLGGGVCQPSSTLYMAVLRADLKVVERHNHTFASSYTPLGEDATVSFGSVDFRFRNNTEYPVKILSNASGRTMRVRILGTNLTGKRVTTTREVLATYPPATVEKQDNTLPVGTRTVQQHAEAGYKVKVYKVIQENGSTKRVLANTSVYKKMDEIILVGTKTAQTTATDTQTATSSASGADTAAAQTGN